MCDFWSAVVTSKGEILTDESDSHTEILKKNNQKRILYYKMKFVCNRPLAFDSPDHINPHGTRRDNSRNKAFNKKLYRLLGENKYHAMLDLGCSGGGFVKDCVDDGHTAYGIDGSDYSLNNLRAEWRTIPEHLFVADITKDFYFLDDDGKRILFDCITLWDVIEHIKEGDLYSLMKNLYRNVKDDGIIIMSVGCIPDIQNNVALHQTVKGEAWWAALFKEHDFVALPKHKAFFGNQFIKGKATYKSGFVVVLGKKGKTPILVPHRTYKERLFDKWSGCALQTMLSKIVNGYTT